LLERFRSGGRKLLKLREGFTKNGIFSRSLRYQTGFAYQTALLPDDLAIKSWRYLLG